MKQKLFKECKYLYCFNVDMTSCIITHLPRGAEIAPLEWNFKTSLGWKEVGEMCIKKKD